MTEYTKPCDSKLIGWLNAGLSESKAPVFIDRDSTGEAIVCWRDNGGIKERFAWDIDCVDCVAADWPAAGRYLAKQVQADFDQFVADSAWQRR